MARNERGEISAAVKRAPMGGVGYEPHDRLLRLRQVMEIVGLGRTSIYQLSKKGLFPKPLKLTESSTRWIEREVYDWLADCARKR